MDTRGVDRLTKSFATIGTRRGLLRLAASMPLGLTLAALLEPALEATANDDDHGSSHRRHRHKARHRHKPGENKKHRKHKGQGKPKGKRKNQSPAADSQPASPLRTTIRRTFTDTTPITILPGPDTQVDVATPASPYPSVIEVAGFANGRILDVTLTLHGLSHSFPGDIDILLAAEHLPGLNAFVMSDTGGGTDVSDVTLTLDNQATDELPAEGGFGSGTFQPTNYASFGTEEFPAPAPAPSGNVGLGVFTGSDPNGTWQLFVVDDIGLDGGSIANGWSLEITAEVDA